MRSRKTLLEKSLLYLILDKGDLPGLPFDGVGVIQLRDKVSDKSQVLNSAFKLAKRLRKTKTLFIINDYIDIAILSGSDGVHLGQHDLPLKYARRLLGKDKIIGISCHNLEQAMKAQQEGADYIGIGPIYPTATKPEYRAIGLEMLRQLKGRIKIPYFAIGSINEVNIKEIIDAGARRVAICRAILKSGDPAGASKRLFDKIRKATLE
ncbi:MAG: thiamine phosphate synthase [Candidatus Omnitrophica bacterium]|nr:thiamine phosphate synthase [Candidatus Omnitrophota bacterium]